MMTMIVNHEVIKAELQSDNLDLLSDVADMIDKIVEEHYPNKVD